MGRVMQSPADYRQYAEECERLARKRPEHKEVLLEMAMAWLTCMEGPEQKSQAQSGEDMTSQRKVS